jgi:hypothetical protein
LLKTFTRQLSAHAIAKQIPFADGEGKFTRQCFIAQAIAHPPFPIFLVERVFQAFGHNAAHAPEGIALDDLVPLGPINILKLAYVPKGFPRRLVAELWFYPDGSRILELSDKCRPAAGFQLAAETRAFLAERGVDLTGEQQTKTRTALEHFSKVAQAQA